MPEDIISVNIFNQEYKIKLGGQDPDYIKKLAKYVDGKISEFTKDFPEMPQLKLLWMPS